jgi:hypothetical protein
MNELLTHTGVVRLGYLFMMGKLSSHGDSHFGDHLDPNKYTATATVGFHLKSRLSNLGFRFVKEKRLSIW